MSVIQRRSFLHGLGAAAVATAAPSVARSESPDNPCRLVLISAGGGWDISYALDPKPGVPTVDSPDGDIQVFADLPIFVDESRPNVTAFFEAWAERCTLIHGIGMRSISHITCGQKIATGYGRTDVPDTGAIVGHERGRELPLPYLVLGDVAFSGTLGVSTGRVGSINQISALLPPEEFLPEPPRFVHERFDPTSGDENRMRQFLERRAQRERALRGARGYNRRRIEDFEASLRKADAVRARAGDFGDFAFAYELRDQADFAVRALAEDLAFTVGLDSRLDWDTHGYNPIQRDNHESLFDALAYVAQRLDEAPGRAGGTLLDETIVVVASEMSRTPLLNEAGGKDHWPTTSMLMFGGPASTGRTFGASNDLVEAEPMDIATGELDPDGIMLEPKHILAGVIEQGGVEPATYFPGVEPFRAPFA